MAKKKSATKKVAVRIEKERLDFRRLIAANPNYFGNLKKSQFKVVKAIQGNAKYEEATCIGFHPKTNRLEATVAIKRSSGYGGNLCQSGSTEYVRFYINYGGGWEDAGLAQFKAYDIPTENDCAGVSEKPLCYVATTKIDPKKRYCKFPVLPKVRAILSWNLAPPANSPDWPPVWGNVLERHIQIKPRQWFFGDIADAIGVDAVKKIKLPIAVEQADLVPIPLPDPPPFKLADLTELYSAGSGKKSAKLKTTVEPHRFGQAEIESALSADDADQTVFAAKALEWKNLGLDFKLAVDKFVQTKGNVNYEELDCLGLNYNSEQLVATFRVKKPSGFSGGLCTNGSKEFITFWADWDDTCQWKLLGTVAVPVHDIATIPAGGLHYSAFLPVNLTAVRRKCDKPKVGRVRAVLSWNSPASFFDPDKVPHWGNRKDCHVLIRPGKKIPPGTIEPLFHRIGGIRDDDISNFTGETLPTATFDNGQSADGAGRPCPFAGRVVITGWPYPGQNYRIQVRKVGEVGWTSLVNTIEIEPLIGLKYSKSPVGEYYSYETLFNNPDLTLGWWPTSGNDAWYVKLDIQGQPGVAIQRVQLKNSGIEDARIHIAAGGDCGKFNAGDILSGAFVARDPYLRGYSLGTAPFGAPAGQLVPTSGNVQTLPAPAIPTAPPPGGLAWTLDTTGMKSCGYTLHLHVSDRAIINSVPNGHKTNRSVGFCLLNPGE